MTLALEGWQQQSRRWPTSGRVILAQHDARTVVVYQAYRPDIGRPAARAGRFGEGFSLSRMSWVKPNFLWMMYRCGWATKENQETVLAIHLQRAFFDSLLAQAVPSTWWRERHASEAEWQAAVRTSEVRLQWDPDHHPHGARLERRALQLGLRGAVLAAFARGEGVACIEDVTDFVAEQRALVAAKRLDALTTPREDVCPVAAPTAVLLGMNSPARAPGTAL